MSNHEYEVESSERQMVQIARADSLGKLIDFTDQDPFPELYNPAYRDESGRRPRAPRLALNYVKYDKGQDNKATVRTTHWMTAEAILVLAYDMLNMRRGDKDPNNEHLFRPLVQEFKGGPERLHPDDRESTILSRVLTVTYADKMPNGEPRRSGPVYQFRFKKGPGQKGENGQVTPIKGAELLVDENFDLRVQSAEGLNARHIAEALRSYLQAKQAAAIVCHHLTRPLWEQLSELERRTRP